MTRFFQNTKLGLKLPVAMGVLVAVTIVILTVANTLMTRSQIVRDASQTLESIAFLKREQITTLMYNIERDIRLRAADPATSLALVALADGYNSIEDPEEVLRRVYIEENEFPLGEKDQLVKADTGSSYGFIHAIYHPPLDAVQDAMNYYDIFLFDTEGNLVYSVFKENDFATNMIDGPWADSGLAEAYRRAAAGEASAETVFVDFQPYGPSYDQPAAFIARPIFNNEGTRLGVLAYQMPVAELNAAAGELEGLGRTADSFVVGTDRRLRTDSQQTAESDSLKTTVTHGAISAAFSGASMNFLEEGHAGQPVMGFATPLNLDFLGVQWIIVAQQDKAELFEGLWAAIYRALAISAGILAMAIGFAVMLSRSISRPLVALTEAVNDVAEGATDTTVPCTDRGDEIGQLARRTETFRQNAKHIEELAEEQKLANQKMAEMAAEREKAAQREIDFAKDKEKADRQAELDRQAMMQDLGASFGEAVDAALDGNFSIRVKSDFNDAVINDLSGSINGLLASMEESLSKTGDVLARVAQGDLTSRMAGNFRGAFHDLQSNVNNTLDALTSLIVDISRSSQMLSDSSSDLLQTADILSRQAEQNAASVEETSAAIEELTVSLAQVDENLGNVSKNANEAKKSAADSEVVASEAAASMDRIAEGSREINRVTGMINDIAFQINLLALNAGVEAARAGSAGRGFSVVASEVRQLAQRASEAVAEIADVLSQSDAAVHEGVAKVSNAKAALDTISQKVVSISDSVEDVTRAISEQAGGIKEISSAVGQIDGNTQKQAASFEEVTASSHLLAKEAQELIKSTSRFQIEETPGDAVDRGADAPKAA